MERLNYTEFAGGFDQVVLEESFVLNLKTTMSFVEFQVNFAVNEKYPLWTPPEAPPPPRVIEEEYELEVTGGELEIEEAPPPMALEYSYRTGRIFFPNMEQVRWESRIQPYIDPASGSVDYGAIDYFYREGDRYFLAGYWGELDLVSGPPLLEIDELKNQSKAGEHASQRGH